MGNLDEDAIRLKQWQTSIEGRLTALEATPAPSTGGSAAPDNTELEALKVAVADLKAQVEATNATLANVEAALSPLHETVQALSTPTQPPPPDLPPPDHPPPPPTNG